MKLATLILALALLLGAAGCRFGAAVYRYPDGSTLRVVATSVLTDPAIGELSVSTSTTQGSLTLKGYSSKSDMTAADLIKMAAALAKP